MLVEADPPIATLLWQLAHSVRMWSAQPAAERAGLFAALDLERRRQIAAAIAEYPTLRWPLRTLELMVSSPHAAREREIALACSKVMDWADALHMTETALQFAEAAALANSRDARLAAVAGSACARLADSARAEIWYWRAIRLGRRAEDWEWFIRANLRLANLAYEHGAYPRARRHYRRALRTARWRGRALFAAQGAHGLVTVAIQTASYDVAERLAIRALGLYPVHAERVPHLAHDVAFLMLRHGWYSRAARILDAVLELIPRPHERIVVQGSIARAAAGMRNRARFEQAAGEVQLLGEISDEGAAMACVHLAEGRAAFEEWAEAETLAARALEIATRRGEQDTARQAHATLGRITSRLPLAPEPTTGTERIDAAVTQVLERLAALSAPALRPGSPTVTTSELPVLTTPA